MPPVWLNGRVIDGSQALISPLDRGFSLADGVFETIRVANRRPLWLADHVARLKAGAATLGIPFNYQAREMELAVAQLTEPFEHQDAAVRITLTRGPSSKRGLWPPGEPVHPTLLIAVSPLAVFHPQDLIICRSTLRNEHSPLSRIKSLNYGDNLLARREAIDRGASDALMLNTSGNLACATVGNVFLRIEGRWVTPRLVDGVLPGLARARLIERMKAIEAPIPAQLIASAEAGFISNSLGCAAIEHLEDRRLADIAGDVDLALIYSHA